MAIKVPSHLYTGENLPRYLGLSNSNGFGVLISLQMAFGSYEVGVIQRIPVPDLTGFDGKHLGELALSALGLKQSPDAANETSHLFVMPALLRVPGNTLAERTANWVKHTAAAKATLVNLHPEIDKIAAQLYGIAEADQQLVQVSPDAGIIDLDGEEDDEETHVEETSRCGR